MRTQFEIQNLKCDGCGNTILRNLGNIDGIDQIHLDVDSGTVSFEHDQAIKAQEVRSALSTMGYPVAGDANPLLKIAKSFVSCAVGRVQS